MLDAILSFDHNLFLALNSSLHWAPFDVLMMWLSEVKDFYFLYALLLFLLFWKGGARGKSAAFAIIITILLTDQISSELIKPFFHRLRPCHALAGVIAPSGCGGGYSFPSSHSTNMFALAVVLRAFYPRRQAWYFLFAALTAYSRIHLGVHYPLDVLGGAVFGAAVAWCVVWGVRQCALRGKTMLARYAGTWRSFRFALEWAALKKYTLPVFSGILLGMAFPPFHLGILAAFGLVPLLFAIEHSLHNGKFHIFRVLYIAFFVMHGIANYWVGGWGNNVDPFLEIACCALMLVHPLFLSVPMYAYVWVRKRAGLLPALALLPFLWTAFEYLHSIGDLGYPWLTLGNTQTYFTEAIQFIEYTGVYGASFVLLVQNVCLFLIIYHLLGKASQFKRELILPFAVLVASIVLPAWHGEYVFRENAFNHEAHKTFRTAVIQPNVDPWGKWNSISDSAQIANLERLSRTALPQKPDVFIWPETAVPVYLTAPDRFMELAHLHAFVDSTGVPLITGFLDEKIYPDGQKNLPPPPPDATIVNGGHIAAYNADMLMEPHSKALQTYHKMELVPFAERTPFVSELPFLAHLIQWSVGLSGWSKGTDFNVFKVSHDSNQAVIWPMICYESVYPSLVRGFVDSGATALAIITNDGWYGRSPGPVQHQQYAILRAIENRRAIARCANTGISCFIDKFGNVDNRTALFTETSIVGDMELNADKTFYTLYGDVLAWLCCLIGVAGLVWMRLKKTGKD